MFCPRLLRDFFLVLDEPHAHSPILDIAVPWTGCMARKAHAGSHRDDGPSGYRATTMVGGSVIVHPGLVLVARQQFVKVSPGEVHAGRLDHLGADEAVPNAEWIMLHIADQQIREKRLHVLGSRFAKPLHVSLRRAAANSPFIIRLRDQKRSALLR